MTILFIITKDFNEDERMPTVPTDVAKDLKGFFTRFVKVIYKFFKLRCMVW